MAKRAAQRVRLVLADGTDLSSLITQVDIPVNHEGVTSVTAKFVGVTLDVDPETRQITITAGG
jgi:hypothetical protein